MFDYQPAMPFGAPLRLPRPLLPVVVVVVVVVVEVGICCAAAAVVRVS